MHKGFLVTASLAGALAVALGAFAAHGLRQMAPADILTSFETGVRYQFYHTFALLAVAILFEKFAGTSLRWAGICFQTGIVLFSGSLYAYTVLKATETAGSNIVVFITPFGGLFFIAGWILMMTAIVRSAKN